MMLLDCSFHVEKVFFQTVYFKVSLGLRAPLFYVLGWRKRHKNCFCPSCNVCDCGCCIPALVLMYFKMIFL